TMIAFVVSRWGRLVFARAIRIAAESGEAPRRDALRVSPAVFLNYLYISSFTEFLSVMTMIVCIAPALVTMLSGIAIGSAELNDHPSIAAPFRRISRYGRELKTSAALMLIFGCALAVAAINVGAAFGIGWWLAGAAGGFDAHRWSILLSVGNHR